MVSLLCLAAASLLSNVGLAEEIEDKVAKTPIVEFMYSNFDTFVNKYNEYHEDKLLATKLIRTRNLILEDNEKGYYFDFDNGFMVASVDYEIYLISNNDLPYENDLFLDVSNIYFNGSSFYNDKGYEYRILNDHLVDHSVIKSKVESLSTNDCINTDGGIEYSDIYNYISSNYSGFNILSESYIKSYDYIGQHDTSVYVKPFDSGSYSEGNCVINSTYSMLHNLGKKNYDRNFYHNDYYVNYTGEKLIHDAHYYLTNNGWIVNKNKRYGTPNKGKAKIEVMPDLYLKLRERAISSYGYDEVNGMQFRYAKNMAMDVVGWYGYKTSFFESDDMELVKRLVDSDIPSLVASYNSIKYGNHSMVVNGYIKLEKTTGWWIFTSTDRKWLLSVDDGHQDSCENGGENERRFYDPNKKGGAKFICADKNTLDYSLC